MHFCVKCDNMYYIKLKESGDEEEHLNKLIYCCRQCNYEDTDLVVDQSVVCVSKSYINKKQGNYKDILGLLPNTRFFKKELWKSYRGSKKSF